MRCPAGSTKLPRPPRTSAHTVVAFRAFSRAVKGRPRAAAAVNTRRVPSCWKPHASRNRTARACLVKGRAGCSGGASGTRVAVWTAGRRTGQHESGRPWTPDSSSGTVPCPGVHELRSACKRCQHAGTNRCSTAHGGDSGHSTYSNPEFSAETPQPPACPGLRVCSTRTRHHTGGVATSAHPTSITSRAAYLARSSPSSRW